MTNDELKLLVESNARTAQAILDSMAEARLEREKLREGTEGVQEGKVRFQDAVIQLTNIQENIAQLLASL